MSDVAPTFSLDLDAVAFAFFAVFFSPAAFFAAVFFLWAEARLGQDVDWASGEAGPPFLLHQIQMDDRVHLQKLVRNTRTRSPLRGDQVAKLT